MTDVDPITCTDRTHYFQPSVNGVQPPLCYCGQREVGEMCGVAEVLIKSAPTAPADSRADLLRRAADRLDELDNAATDGPWTAREPIGATDPYDVPIYGAGGYLCASPDDGVRGGHSNADADLIVALRAVVSPLSRWLRHQAEYAYTGGDKRHYISGHGAHALDVARAILGEEVPW